MFGRQGGTREQRLAEKARQKQRAEVAVRAEDAARRKAAVKAAQRQACDDTTAKLKELGWTDASVQIAGRSIVAAGTDKAGLRHSSAAATPADLVAQLQASASSIVAKVIAAETYNDVVEDIAGDLEDEDEDFEEFQEEAPAAPPPIAPPPDLVARLVPNTVKDQERIGWLRQRLQELTHRLVDGGKALEPLSEAELVEHQELERYRGYFG